MDGVLQDLRLSFRTLCATPVVSIAAAFSLALGIGASTAAFSLVDSLLLRQLRVQDPEELVSVSTGSQQSQRVFSFATWDAMRDSVAFDRALAYAPPSRLRVTIAQEGDSEIVDALWMSGSSFEILGVPAALGRLLTPLDDVQGGGPNGPVAVISHRMWQRRYGGSPDVIDSRISVEQIPFTIVGVTPSDFHGFDVGRDFDLALPIYAQPLIRGAGAITRDQPWLRLVRRLSPGQSIDAATIAARAAQPAVRENSLPRAAWRPGFLAEPFVLEPVGKGTSSLRAAYGDSLITVFGLAALVLVIACANIANLMLARGVARRSETSLRLALGASRGRVLRYVFLEASLLAAIGGIGGLAFAAWAGSALIGQLSTEAAQVVLDLSLDFRVLTFTGLLLLGSMLIFGVVPAMRSLRTAPIEAMKSSNLDGGRASRAGLPSGLVVTQVAIAVVLVAAFTMFARTISRLADADLGFDRDRVLLVGVDASRATVVEADRTAFYARLVEAVKTVPGVNDAGGSLSTPFGIAPSFPIVVTRPGVDPSSSPATRAVELDGITPGWRSTYGVVLISGRDIDEADRANTQPVIIVNEAFVRRFLPDTNPLGALVDLAAGAGGELSIGTKTVVGVIGNTAWRSVRSTDEPAMYIPVTQWPNPLHPTTVFSISARSANSSPALIAPGIRSTLLALDDRLVLSIRPLGDQVGRSMTQERLLAQLSTFFGSLGVLLAGLGLYGVTSHAVSRRRAEIGIRLAIGAAPCGIIRLVLSRVAVLVTAGAVVGIVVSRWLANSIAPLLYGVEPNDWKTLLTAVLVLGIAGGLAAWVPARRASRLDPSIVLKST